MTKKNDYVVVKSMYDPKLPEHKKARLEMTQEELDAQKQRIANRDFIPDMNVDWFCDNCEAFMNTQIGFTALTGKWVCTHCGYENDVSMDNVSYWSDDL